MTLPELIIYCELKGMVHEHGPDGHNDLKFLHIHKDKNWVGISYDPKTWEIDSAYMDIDSYIIHNEHITLQDIEEVLFPDLHISA